MTRIIGGSAGGRRLRSPTGDRTRPTSDRVREALFSALESGLGTLAGLRFLDLYAGSGAVGLEALSRGAVAAVLVESDRRTASAVLQANLDTVGLPGGSVVAHPVEKHLAHTTPGEGFDVVFADPPYAVSEEDLAAVLALLVERDWLAPDATVVVERSRRSPEPTWPVRLVGERSKRYGETVVWWARLDTGATDPRR